MDKKIESYIKIGETYTYFNDGKITENRKMDVIINDIIPFSEETNLELLKLWNIEVKDCNWLYKKETDYFIKGTLIINEHKSEQITFVRTIHDEWFSLGYWGGILDYDGNLLRCLNTRKYI